MFHGAKRRLQFKPRRHTPGVTPSSPLKTFVKWLGERFTRPARSAIATGSSMCAPTQSVTRRICHGGSILGDSGLRIDPGDAPLPLLSDLVINMDDRISLKGTAKTCQGPPRGAHLSPRRRPLNTGKAEIYKESFFLQDDGTSRSRWFRRHDVDC